MIRKTKSTAHKEEAKPTLVPKLRFPEFRETEGWGRKKVGSMLIESPRPIELEDEVEYCLVTVKRRYGGLVSRGNLKGNEIKVNSQFLVHGGDFLISKRQIVHDACGLVPAALDGSVVSNEYSVLTPRAGCSIEFFNWFAQQPCVSRSFSECSVGIVIEKMLFKLPSWLNREFLFPPLPEQQKIASCLSSADELMAAQARKVDALKSHKKGLMQQLFPREGETQPRLRFPEFQNAWEWKPKTLVDACRMQAGKFVAAADIKELSAAGMFPCYGGNGLRGCTETYTHDGVYPLIGRQGALCGNVKLATGMFHATEHAVVATPKRGVDVVWLYFLLDLLNLNRFATGQAQPGLSVEVLEKVPVTIPSHEPEQQRIATCLSSLDALITAETQKHEALKTHKKGLMQQLFPSPEASEQLPS
jgi:type I restriction enzyme, S subunit